MKTLRALLLGASLSLATPALADRPPTTPPPGSAPTKVEAPKEAIKEPAAASAKTAETKKEGGCAVGQEGSASWLLVLGLGLVISRRKKNQ